MHPDSRTTMHMDRHGTKKKFSAYGQVRTFFLAEAFRKNSLVSLCGSELRILSNELIGGKVKDDSQSARVIGTHWLLFDGESL